jgi:hypothetical protein
MQGWQRAGRSRSAWMIPALATAALAHSLRGGAAGYNHWAAACLARATGRLHRDPGAHADAIAGWERIGAHLERAYTLLLIPARA